MQQLYAHQQALVDKNPSKHLLAWGVGSGKTRASLELAKKNGVRALVICPKNLKEQWGRAIVMWGASADVVSKEEFKRNYQKLPHHNAVIVDECFVTGTKVLTPSGHKNIEEIKVGESVISAVGNDVVVGTSKKLVDEICIIKTCGGGDFAVTGNHRFLTQRGWVCAEKLTTQDVLLHSMFANSILFAYEKMCFLREGTSNKTREAIQSCAEEWDRAVLSKKISTKVLQQCLFREVCLAKKRGCAERKTGERECAEKIVRKDEEEQPNEVRGDKKKSVRKTDGDWSFSKNHWWEWKKYAFATKDSTLSPWERVVRRVSRSNEDGDKRKISDLLQNRHSKSKKENSNRGGRNVSPITKHTREGQEKRRFPNWFRVESVTFRKQKNTFVYNISVKGHPSYTVNSVLVHNCHLMFANYKSQGHKALAKYFKVHNVTYRWLLTGTPYTSSAWSIYSLMRLLDYRVDFWDFRRRFFVERYFGSRCVFVPREGVEDDVAEMVRRVGSVVRLDECIDVPDQVTREEFFTMTKEQKKALDELKLCEPNPLVRFSKAHQIASGTLLGNEFTETVTFPALKNEYIRSKILENDKVAVFCRYNAHIDLLAEECKKDRVPYRIIRGDVKDRDAVVRECEEAKRMVVLINTACSVGYELPSFGVIIFASLDYSFPSYVQACGRFLRINKPKKNIYIVCVTSGSADVPVLEAMRRKESFSEAIYTKTAEAD